MIDDSLTMSLFVKFSWLQIYGYAYGVKTMEMEMEMEMAVVGGNDNY